MNIYEDEQYEIKMDRIGRYRSAYLRSCVAIYNSLITLDELQLSVAHALSLDARSY